MAATLYRVQTRTDAIEGYDDVLITWAAEGRTLPVAPYADVIERLVTMLSRVDASVDTAGLIRARPLAKGGEDEGQDQSLDGAFGSGGNDPPGGGVLRRTSMKRRGLWAACVVLLVGLVGVLAIGAGYAKDESAPAKCSEATLDGTYLFAADGVEIKGNDQLPFAYAGYEVFDGHGKVNQVFSANLNGKITRNESISGTYTVKADCTGTATYADGTRFDQFMAPDGSKLTFVQTHPKRFVTAAFEPRGTAKRVGD